VAGYLLKKILYAVLVAWGVVTVVFVMFHVLPGDPARMMAGQRADENTLERIREDLGLDRPGIVQYLGYLNDLSPVSVHAPENKDSYIFCEEEKYGHPMLLIRFSGHRALFLKAPYLGRSFQSGEKVGRILLQALPNTFILALTSMFLAFVFGSSLRPGDVASLLFRSHIDRLAFRL
jgi:peptide/nickel transport system permease protein